MMCGHFFTYASIRAHYSNGDNGDHTRLYFIKEIPDGFGGGGSPPKFEPLYFGNRFRYESSFFTIQKPLKS